MVPPPETTTFSSEEAAELNRLLSDMRHNVNNHLTLISTAVELMRRKPDSITRMIATLADQPEKIRDEVARFSAEFEKAFRIPRDPLKPI